MDDRTDDCLNYGAGWIVFMRYDFVVAGQIYPIFNNIPLPATVVPTLMEIFVIAGIFGGLLLVYTLAVKFLPLKEGHH